MSDPEDAGAAQFKALSEYKVRGLHVYLQPAYEHGTPNVTGFFVAISYDDLADKTGKGKALKRAREYRDIFSSKFHVPEGGEIKQEKQQDGEMFMVDAENFEFNCMIGVKNDAGRQAWAEANTANMKRAFDAAHMQTVSEMDLKRAERDGRGRGDEWHVE